MTSYLHTAAKCGFRGPSVEQLAATVAEGETTEGTGREEKRDRMREAMRKEQAMLQKYHQLEECQRAQALKKAALLRRQEESRRAEEQQLLAAEREAEAAAAMADEAEVTQKISRLTRQYGDSYLWKGTKPSVDGKGTKQFSRSKLDNEVLTAVGADVPTITY